MRLPSANTLVTDCHKDCPFEYVIDWVGAGCSHPNAPREWKSAVGLLIPLGSKPGHVAGYDPRPEGTPPTLCPLREHPVSIRLK